jgi:outer membrane protein OmpA-like peptidoglycan-associated protein
MRSYSFLCMSLAGALVSFATSDARAQVTLNPDALKQLQATSPAAPPQEKPAPEAHQTAGSLSHPATGAPVVPALPRPRVATVPPEIAQLPPPVVVALRPVARVIPPLPVIGAIGDAVAIKNGIRLDFAPSSSDMNPAMEQALRAFAKHAAPGPVTLDAYASGNDSDPSTPRRLSLARVLAARAILINAGIASAQIYPRAHGPDTGDSAPADRLDIVTLPPSHS